MHPKKLGGGFKYFVYFHPYLGKKSILTIFQMGWFNHQLEKYPSICHAVRPPLHLKQLEPRTWP